MNTVLTHTQHPDPMPEGPFEAAVRDVLQEAGMQGDVLIETLYAIHKAHAPLVAAERGRAIRAERTADALLLRDGALEETAVHVKRTVTLLVNENARMYSHLAYKTSQTEALRILVTASGGPDGAVLARDLLQILDQQAYILPPVPPVPVGVSVDSRHRFGRFTADGGRRHMSYAFVGWSVVVRSQVADSTIESVFMVDGKPLTQSALADLGYTLETLQ